MQHILESYLMAVDGLEWRLMWIGDRIGDAFSPIYNLFHKSDYYYDDDFGVVDDDYWYDPYGWSDFDYDYEWSDYDYDSYGWYDYDYDYDYEWSSDYEYDYDYDYDYWFDDYDYYV